MGLGRVEEDRGSSNARRITWESLWAYMKANKLLIAFPALAWLLLDIGVHIPPLPIDLSLPESKFRRSPQPYPCLSPILAGKQISISSRFLSLPDLSFLPAPNVFYAPPSPSAFLVSGFPTLHMCSPLPGIFFFFNSGPLSARVLLVRPPPHGKDAIWWSEYSSTVFWYGMSKFSFNESCGSSILIFPPQL